MHPIPAPPAAAGDTTARVRRLLGEYHFMFSTEVELQDQIALALAQGKEPFEREFALTRRDRPDFYLPGGIVLEVKTAEATTSILRQLKRYADHPQVTEVVLVSSRPHNLPPALSQKPVSNVSLWRGGL